MTPLSFFALVVAPWLIGRSCFSKNEQNGEASTQSTLKRPKEVSSKRRGANLADSTTEVSAYNEPCYTRQALDEMHSTPRIRYNRSYYKPVHLHDSSGGQSRGFMHGLPTDTPYIYGPSSHRPFISEERSDGYALRRSIPISNFDNRYRSYPQEQELYSLSSSEMYPVQHYNSSFVRHFPSIPDIEEKFDDDYMRHFTTRSSSLLHPVTEQHIHREPMVLRRHENRCYGNSYLPRDTGMDYSEPELIRSQQNSQLRSYQNSSSRRTRQSENHRSSREQISSSDSAPPSPESSPQNSPKASPINSRATTPELKFMELYEEDEKYSDLNLFPNQNAFRSKYMRDQHKNISEDEASLSREVGQRSGKKGHNKKKSKSKTSTTIII